MNKNFRLSDFHPCQSDSVIQLQKDLTGIAATGPENGGEGEAAKAEFIVTWLDNAGIRDIKILQAPDPRVTGGYRPNVIAEIPGRSSTNLWLFAHMDIVPAGNLSSWNSQPFQVHQAGDLLYGRGVEDNQQAIVSMLLLASILQSHKIVPFHGLKLVFLADEETGSQYGMRWLLAQHRELFPPDDLYIVPDGGSPDSSVIGIAEKGQLWLKFTVTGTQCHASMPTEGANSLVAAAGLILKLQALNECFRTADPLFNPPVSTFTPTRHDQNVDAINIMPGQDTFYLDCRLLPGLPIDKALAEIRDACADITAGYNVQIQMDTVHYQPFTSTSPASPVVVMLERAIREVCRTQPLLTGFGGATVASFLRQQGLSAVVWSTVFNSCHQPNEHSSITATCQDTEVFAHILMDDKNV